jgi:membrane-associated phospholipid phosphatase
MALAIVVTFWWKISAHMFGVGGLMGGVMAVSHYVEHVNPHYLIMALFLISGLVGSSRLLLKKHTPAQVYTGFLLGFTVSFICVRLGA